MKGLLVVMVSAVFTGIGTLPAQLSGHTHSFSMDVRPVASGGTTKSTNNLHVHEGTQLPGYYQTQQRNFSSTRKRGSGVGLQVEVRNLGQFTNEATVEWYFLGKSAKGGDPFIFDQGSRTLSVGSASREIVDLASDELTSTVVRRLSLRSGYAGGFQNNLPSASVEKSGSKIAGWIVRLKVDGQIAQIRASSPSMEAVGRNEQKLRLLSRKAK